VLRNGSQVLIRQVRSTDAPLLADGFAGLSARSRRMRFLTDKKQLSAAELRYYTEVDHHDHEALGALSLADGRGVGIVRYVRDADDPQAAEIAVTIADDWQGRGLGTELLARLSECARQAGIHRSPRWSPPTTRRWPDCFGTWAPNVSATGSARWNTRSR
jgi:GNAT superfamily N-acetyltransferase